MYGYIDSKVRRTSKLHDLFKSYNDFNNIFCPWFIRAFWDLEPVYWGLWLLVLAIDGRWHETGGRWHVTSDTWHVTCEMWLVTRDMWHMIFFKRKVPENSQKVPKKNNKNAIKCKKVSKQQDFIVLVLLSAHEKRVGVSRMHFFSFSRKLSKPKKRKLFLAL